MSSPSGDPQSPAGTPDGSPSVSGVTRSRDEFDTDSGDDTSAEFPSSKQACTGVGITIADAVPDDPNSTEEDPEDSTALALCEELECGMCAGVFIDPVALNGCGHVFCGSCVQQWIKSLPKYPLALLPGDPVPEPIACPHCRHAPVQTATPSRLAKTMVAFLLSRMPSMARPPNELRQANEIYTSAMGVLKFPVPPPPPRAPLITEFWRPCRSCYPTEEGAWHCPIPIARFEVPAERDLCVRADGIPPDGHRICARCDRLSPCQSPKSSNCGICGEGFCGEALSGCECVPVSQSQTTSQFAHFANVLVDCPSDMLALAFKENWDEMTHLSVFVSQNPDARSATNIYRSILDWLRTPEGIESGGVVGMMNRADINLRLRTGMADELQKAVMLPEEGAAEAKICGGCADEILCAGIIEWWIRELKKPGAIDSLPAHIRRRPNCKYGRKCTRQENHPRHAQKFNHICEALPSEEAAQIHQDDSMPAATSDNTNDDDCVSVSSIDSDDERDNDNDDAKQHVDVSTQWEASPEGGTTLIVPIQEPIKGKWLVPASQSAGAALVNNPPGQSMLPALSIANIVNPEPSVSTSRAATDGSSASTPVYRTSSPHQGFLAAPNNVSGSSSPFVASFSWPTLSPNNQIRAETPPLGVSFGGNSGTGSADSELAVTTAKLSLPPLSPTLGKSPSHYLTFEEPSLFAEATQTMDVDV